MPKTILNIEADEIIYRSAFAVQFVGYIFRSKSGNERDLKDMYTKTKLIKFMRENGKELNLDYTLERYVIAEPVQHCLRIIHNTIKRLSAFGEPVLWLSPRDKSNFRFNVAKTAGPRGLGYKAGRPEKPVHYQAARDYVIQKYGAKEIRGYEADDALGLYQTDDTVAVHIDKDINTVPGKHINWVTGEHYEVPTGLGYIERNGKKILGRGRKFFYFQLLTGDATDNIPGLPGIGDITAFNLLENCFTEEECYRVVLDMYETKLGPSKETLDRLAEVADLLWICQKEGETGRDILNRMYT